MHYTVVMPIHVAITVNDLAVENLHIARMSGASRAPDSVHTYSVLRQKEEPRREQEWNVGVLFTHRYGDDVTVLVQQAISALQSPQAAGVHEAREDITASAQRALDALQ